MTCGMSLVPLDPLMLRNAERWVNSRPLHFPGCRGRQPGFPSGQILFRWTPQCYRNPRTPSPPPSPTPVRPPKGTTSKPKDKGKAKADPPAPKCTMMETGYHHIPPKQQACLLGPPPSAESTQQQPPPRSGSPMRRDQNPIPERPTGETSAAPKPSSTAPAPAPMAVDQEAEEPLAKRRKVHDRGPRPQPRKPVAPFQHVGLPSNPRDIRSALRPPRAWNIVTCKGAKSNGPTKPSYVEAAATLAHACPNLKPLAISKTVNNPPLADPHTTLLAPLVGEGGRTGGLHQTTQ